jgi:hypothetical protein
MFQIHSRTYRKTTHCGCIAHSPAPTMWQRQYRRRSLRRDAEASCLSHTHFVHVVGYSWDVLPHVPDTSRTTVFRNFASSSFFTGRSSKLRAIELIDVFTFVPLRGTAIDITIFAMMRTVAHQAVAHSMSHLFTDAVPASRLRCLQQTVDTLRPPNRRRRHRHRPYRVSLSYINSTSIGNYTSKLALAV